MPETRAPRSNADTLMVRRVPAQVRRDLAAEAARRGIRVGQAVALAVAWLKTQEVPQ